MSQKDHLKLAPVPPAPPHTPSARIIKREGAKVAYIWLLSEAARETIETQYKNASQIRGLKGCAKSTAYRIIKQHTKRYWLIDLTIPDHPEVCCVLPTKLAMAAEVKPVGNPHFSNGIYQQEIASKRRRYGIDKSTY